MGTLSNDNTALFDRASSLVGDTLSSGKDNIQQMYNSAIYSGSPFAKSSDAFKASLNGRSSNTFGVNDVRQMVKDLDSGAIGDSEVYTLPTDILTNLESKYKSVISNDAELSEAFKKAGDEISKISQNMLSSGILAEKDLFKTNFSYDQFFPFDMPSLSGIGNYTDDPLLRSVIPLGMTTSDYGKMQDIFNKGGMNLLSECPNLNDALNYAKKLLDPSQIFGSLSSLFSLLSLYDISGVINCLSRSQSQLNMIQRKGLSDSLISGGSLRGFSDYQSIGGSSSVIDKYDTVRRLSSNRKVTIDPYTRQTNNTWKNPDIISTSDSLLNSFDIDKSSLFSASTINPSKNSSILNSINDDVFDATEIAKYNPASGFVDYCIGNKSKLLSPLSAMFS
jgi:hypothetical protein